MNLELLRKAIESSWDKDTCYPPMRKEYSKNNPAYGQCHCTTLVINDYLGGEILEYIFKDETGHYSNYINGAEIDFTRCQFSPDEVFPEPRIIQRSNTKNTEEYFILKRRVEEFIRNR